MTNSREAGDSLPSTFGQWQPIETAPTGVKLITWGRAPGRMRPMTMMARYWKQHSLPVPDGYEGEDWAEIDAADDSYMPAGWYEEIEAEDGPAYNICPTHWMPLPPPPEGETT